MDRARSEDSTSCFENTHAAVTDQTMQQQQQQEVMYACTICLQTATHPVASTCGHLFCWECLFSWLQGRPGPCPVCRTNLIQGVNIIPIFTFTGVVAEEYRALEPPSGLNTTAAAAILQRPPPPPPDRIPVPIPLPSPEGAVINIADSSDHMTVDDYPTLNMLDEIMNDLTDNFEISRDRVDSLGQTVENLVRWNLRLRQENDRNAQLIKAMNRHHGEEIEAIHGHYAEMIGGVIRQIHTQANEAMPQV